MRSYRWIPWAFAGALGVVVAANGALAYFAAVSSTGLVTEHPFAHGNDYNRVLDAAAAQDALGWRGTVRFLAEGAERGEIAAEFADRDGRPLAGLAVTARILRPLEPLPESIVSLSETTAGRYAADVALDRPGQWELRIAARRGADRFEFMQRIAVK
ncbi:MAG TPA: FixH family protein [Stellaceae bacterium]